MEVGQISAPLHSAIRIQNLGKCYQLYAQPKDRLKQFLWRGKRQFYQELWALREINLQVMPGEVIGIVGRNGSGKSTLLQLICGTLTPTCGEIQVKGRLAALLELGAGFNPEFTGRENIWLNAAIMGLSQDEIAERIEQIIDFSEIRDFIDQPVKTYSSGMYVRLAFSVAVSVDPDILIIDEALSVGDGSFARKSFNRIMQLKDNGRTILFCSHSLFQIESLCTRVLWINQGRLMAEGDAKDVVSAYQTFLDKSVLIATEPVAAEDEAVESVSINSPVATGYVPGHARLDKVDVLVDGETSSDAVVKSSCSTVSVTVSFASDPAVPCPTVAITLHAMDGRMLTSAATWEDHVVLKRTGEGTGQTTVIFDQLPLLKGEYLVSVYLLCEKGIHLYDSVNGVSKLRVQQEGRLQGYFTVPHRWEAGNEI
ncbi:MAG TPA: ABC transporter ATP-binding protein [Nitrosomonas nitrosa]|jgi:lipopolysaccharide transport system ATP-binding protein|uniref:ABC transporter ATP-binding protein n=1 Tax=Nitrosomonas nitrosa TaxID=52442 RepID=UPI000D3208B4|nr:ABC transporter ATP-binding protein [Nitrosomonas nitrosa]PTR00184.1 lipopolysaccharide transport system ATP-binding protein [Nitrosomonas nitrosa]HBZ31254.1 ABC transporter ATP-binding protein [Nitrosomonas nitrosa]